MDSQEQTEKFLADKESSAEVLSAMNEVENIGRYICGMPVSVPYVIPELDGLSQEERDKKYNVCLKAKRTTFSVQFGLEIEENPYQHKNVPSDRNMIFNQIQLLYDYVIESAEEVLKLNGELSKQERLAFDINELGRLGVMLVGEISPKDERRALLYFRERVRSVLGQVEEWLQENKLLIKES